MLIDVEIVAVFVEQLDMDWHVSAGKVFVDPLTGLRQEFLYDSSCGGLELHRRHEQDMGDAVTPLDDSRCTS